MMNTIIYLKVNTHGAFHAILGCKIEAPSVCINFPENTLPLPTLCADGEVVVLKILDLSVRHRFVGD